MGKYEYKNHAFAGRGHRMIFIMASDGRDEITPRQRLMTA
jgi:hypothetical protein